jgi:hypothetical protein
MQQGHAGGGGLTSGAVPMRSMTGALLRSRLRTSSRRRSRPKRSLAAWWVRFSMPSPRLGSAVAPAPSPTSCCGCQPYGSTPAAKPACAQGAKWRLQAALQAAKLMLQEANREIQLAPGGPTEQRGRQIHDARLDCRSALSVQEALHSVVSPTCDEHALGVGRWQKLRLCHQAGGVPFGGPEQLRGPCNPAGGRRPAHERKRGSVQGGCTGSGRAALTWRDACAKPTQARPSP